MDDDSQDYSETFEKAASHLPTLVGELEDVHLLYLYSRFKQATIGPCNTDKPGIFDFQGRKKWNAWKELGNMSASQAKEEYVNKIKACDPDWDVHKPTNSSTSIMGPAVSRPVIDCDEVNPNESILFDICKQGDVEKLANMDEDLSVGDTDERTLLHWACDRGHLPVVKFLLKNNCDVNAKDIDHSTPLHYASSCGYIKIVEILLSHGADPNAKDKDGDTPIECAETDKIRELLLKSKALT
uniref:acyl-CoA-binding domain-containing protein 6-like n=1 Tax=Styela clava TaxID=7725 RepID=UPI001939E2FF|nr:acyl-CoA-binding domain-containing protein 6-like [Styela clava]